MATEFEAASDASTKRFVVTVPEGNGYSEPSTIGRIVDHFRQLSINADFEMKDSIAVKNTDGSYTLITRDHRTEALAQYVLSQHYGLLSRPLAK